MCRIRKNDSDLRLASGEEEQSESVLEGLLETCVSTTGHIVLAEAVTIRVYGPDPYDSNARSVLQRRAERALVDIRDVKECRFVGVNITREGMVTIKNFDCEPEDHKNNNKEMNEDNYSTR